MVLERKLLIINAFLFDVSLGWQESRWVYWVIVFVLVGGAVWLSHVIPFFLFLTCVKKVWVYCCELSDVMGGSSYECVIWLQWAGVSMGGWVEVSEIPFHLRCFFLNGRWLAATWKWEHWRSFYLHYATSFLREWDRAFKTIMSPLELWRCMNARKSIFDIALVDVTWDTNLRQTLRILITPILQKIAEES